MTVDTLLWRGVLHALGPALLFWAAIARVVGAI